MLESADMDAVVTTVPLPPPRDPISPASTISLIFWYRGLLRWLNMIAKVRFGFVAALSSLTCRVYTPARFSIKAWTPRLRLLIPTVAGHIASQAAAHYRHADDANLGGAGLL